jgi:putative transposase
MKLSRLTREQIIGILKRTDAGISIEEVCRCGGFSQPPPFKWRFRFSGMGPSNANKLSELETVNSKLQELLVEVNLDTLALQRESTVKPQHHEPNVRRSRVWWMNTPF